MSLNLFVFCAGDGQGVRDGSIRSEVHSFIEPASLHFRVRVGVVVVFARRRIVKNVDGFVAEIRFVVRRPVDALADAGDVIGFPR